MYKAHRAPFTAQLFSLPLSALARLRFVRALRWSCPVQSVAAMYFPLLALASSCLFSAPAAANVTIYGLFGQTTVDPTATGSANVDGVAVPTTTTFITARPAVYTGLEAYNDIYIAPPAIPSPAPPTTFALGVPTDATLLGGLSIQQQGTFLGFSIEMSVANQLSESFPLCHARI